MYKHTLSPLIFAAAMILSPVSGKATLVDVTTAGNLLALLPINDLNSSSADGGFVGGITDAVDNFVGTSDQDNGLVFNDGDPHQLFAITGFDGSLGIGDIRLFTSQNDIRVPPSVTIFYSTLSTLSLDSSDSAYTGANGGLLLPTFALTGSDFANPIPGSTNAYMDLAVNAPAGTQSLLFDFGSASNLPGSRISEAQAFAAPEPASLGLVGLFAGLGLLGFARRRSR